MLIRQHDNICTSKIYYSKSSLQNMVVVGNTYKRGGIEKWSLDKITFRIFFLLSLVKTSHSQQLEVTWTQCQTIKWQKRLDYPNSKQDNCHWSRMYVWLYLRQPLQSCKQDQCHSLIKHYVLKSFDNSCVTEEIIYGTSRTDSDMTFNIHVIGTLYSRLCTQGACSARSVLERLRAFSF